MTKLLWDESGKRLYETGLDRGVLYLADGGGVAWSGLTSIEEDFGGDGVSPTYFDGVKTRDDSLIGDYAATLQAFTYPPEFVDYQGSSAIGNGLFIDDQDPKPFGLSYRTLIGNDTSGDNYGYKIHILYNLTAEPDEVGRETLDSDPDLSNFGWRLSGVPEEAPGYRPTAHLIVDSISLGPSRTQAIEDILYGSSTDNPRLPTIGELIDLVVFYAPIRISPNQLTGLSELSAVADGLGDLTRSGVDGLYFTLPTSRLVVSGTPGLYQLASN